jgi:RNA polymerase sigma-70 factor (ECF subfamily)
MGDALDHGVPEIRLMDEADTERNWEQWVAQHTPKFLLFARQRARCEADAQDLVQLAVLEAARRQNDGEPPNPALVYATLHRRAIDQARVEDRRTEREVAASDTRDGSWFDTAVEDREMKQLIEASLRSLPADFREVIVLKVWGERTFAEVADALGIPQNTAASRYRYGLIELRKLMKGVCA